MKRVLVLLSSLALQAFAGQDSVKLCCWIVGNNNGDAYFTPQAVSNMVEGVNQIYRQVAQNFEIESLSRTNDTYLSDLVYSNSAQKNAICNITNNTSALELYFIRRLVGSPTAFQRDDGIVVGPNANARTLAHEIGHACGLEDVYTESDDGTLVVSGSPTKERMPNDWGWYPESVTQADIVRRLLMYGVRSDTKADLSYGDVYGAYYTSTWNRVTLQWDDYWLLGNAPIGFGLHGNRHPVSQ